jgi:UPF0271 protein
MKVIDLSCDLGEARSAEEAEAEETIWTLISSANVACGGHVGDDISMQRAVERARRFHVQLGAHPSFPDRENFGRRVMSMDPAGLRASISSQLQTLQRIAEEGGVELKHVKPHGALYNEAHRDRALAVTIVEAIAETSSSLEIVCAPGSELENVAREQELTVVLEAFGDRRYRDDGTLVPRDSADSLLTAFADAAAQVEQLVNRQHVIADNGKSVVLRFSTICLHGDMARSAGRIRAVRERLTQQGLRISSAGRVNA